jgi:hypothetical protein
MNKMCITGYFVEDTKPTVEERKEELQLLAHYHIEDY